MKKTSLKKNLVYQLCYEVFTIILPLIISPYIARVLGAEKLGEYSYSYSVAYYFVLLSMLGLLNYGNREIARVRNNQEKVNKTFWNIYAMHVVFSILCCIGYVVYIVFKKGEKIYAIIQFAYVLSALFDISWLYFGLEKFKMTAIRNMAIKIINLVCVFIFVKDSNDLWKYCIIMSIGYLFSQLVLWIPLKKYVSFEKPKWKNMKKHVKPMFILFIPALSVSLYKYMDKIMIGALSNKIELGFYENAEKAINIPLTIVAAFSAVMLPKMSNLAAIGDKKQSEKYTKLSMKYVMCLSIALSFGMLGVGSVFAPVFWGNEFVFCGKLVMGLSVTIPFVTFANILRTQFLIPNKRDLAYLVSVLAGAGINLVINTLLIPNYGSIGALIGTVITEIIVCVLHILFSSKELPIIYYLRTIVPFVFFGLIMSIIVYAVGNILSTSIITLTIQIALGVVVYSLLFTIYAIITKDELFFSIFMKLKLKFKGEKYH